MSVIVVHDPGLLATVQDLGRPGHAALGVSRSGAADTLALRTANRLLANEDDDAGIELTMTGGSFETAVDTRVALAGAPCDATIGGRPLYPLRATRVRAGQRITVGPARRGVRTYLCIAGGLRTDPVLGSRSTHASSGFGAPDRRPLRAGDELPIGDAERTAHDTDRDALVELVRSAYTHRLRTLGGRRIHCTVAPRSDRTGTRLIPDSALPACDPIQPEATHHGAIQQTPDGALVALGPDGAPTGGYPLLGTVALADLPALAQLRPNDSCELTPVALGEALRLLREREALLDAAIPRAHNPDA